MMHCPVIYSYYVLLFYHLGMIVLFTHTNVLSKGEQPTYEPHIPIESHQRVSLLDKYHVNYREVMRIRQENMKRYAYEYNMFGIDKRSNLSLQEYRDVYDGKW